MPFTASVSNEKLSKRLLSSKPIGLFDATEDEYLLCYEGKLPHKVLATRMYSRR